MPNHKVNILEKKRPFNCSIRNCVILAFENYCKGLDLDQNAYLEGLITQHLIDVKFQDKEEIK